MDEKFRSRKWMLTIAVQATATIALFAGFINGAEFATISSANVVQYGFANAAQYFAEKK